MNTSGRVVLRHIFALFLGLMSLSQVVEAREEPFQCKAEADYFESISGFESANSPDESFSCFQSIEDADHERSLIVDVRPSQQFQKARIPRSINLTELELFTAQALRARPILVVDKGFSRTALAQMCAKAKAEGFTRFKILLGGVAAWHASGKPLEGLPEYFPELSSIGPNEFLIELRQNRASVLATDVHIDYLGEISPPDLLISKFDPEGVLDRQLLSHLRRTGTGERYPVVLILGDGLPAKSSPSLQSVFSLRSSVQELASAYQKHLAVSEKRKAVPNRFSCGGVM
ncbi:rhodanese-like domain-containing protein [Marinobacter alkaliphilus]|uniref:Rhodanese-like domain-containing protein n=1 Tax=Marinobacter alkaliphilus TaxID=254719 RepID=A0ABZ3E0C9_9GAMM